MLEPARTHLLGNTRPGHQWVQLHWLIDLGMHHLAFPALLDVSHNTMPQAIPPETYLNHPGSAGCLQMTQCMSVLYDGNLLSNKRNWFACLLCSYTIGVLPLKWVPLSSGSNACLLACCSTHSISLQEVLVSSVTSSWVGALLVPELEASLAKEVLGRRCESLCRNQCR